MPVSDRVSKYKLWGWVAQGSTVVEILLKILGSLQISLKVLKPDPVIGFSKKILIAAK